MPKYVQLFLGSSSRALREVNGVMSAWLCFLFMITFKYMTKGWFSYCPAAVKGGGACYHLHHHHHHHSFFSFTIHLHVRKTLSLYAKTERERQNALQLFTLFFS